MRIENGMIKADEGKYINRKGERAQFTSAYLLPNDTIDNFEERAEKLTEKVYPYEDEVEKRIRRRYSLSGELALSRQRDTKTAEFKEYFDYCELCKKEAKDYEAQWYIEEAEREKAEEEARIAWEKTEAERIAREEAEVQAEAERIAKEEAEREKLMAEETARMEAEMSKGK